MSKNAENHYTNENSYMHKWFLKSFLGGDLFKKHSSLKKWFLFSGNYFMVQPFAGLTSWAIQQIKYWW